MNKNHLTISILLVDGHATVREAFRLLLSKQSDMLAVAEAVNGSDAYWGILKDMKPMWSLPYRFNHAWLKWIETHCSVKKHNSNVRMLAFRIQH